MWVKRKWFSVYFKYILMVLSLAYQKNKWYETLEYWSRDIFNFIFFRKETRNSIWFAFCVWFFKKKMFLMLCSIKWINFIAWLPLLLEILVNMCIVIASWSGCDLINFGINLIFLIKSFYTNLIDRKFKSKI